jgi:uncharacterized DUF497 family protein
LTFEWHGPKAAANRVKHKVTFQEAMTVFGDPLGRIADDPRHSENEERFVLLGQSDRRRLLVVMFTERGGHSLDQRAEGNATRAQRI